MIETFSLSPDSRWLVWNVEKDLDRWRTLLSQFVSSAPQAFIQFISEMRANFAGVIAELRQGEDHQLLRPYKYEPTQMSTMVAKRVELTRDLDIAKQRAQATQMAFDNIHSFFFQTGSGAQALVISPPNPDSNLPEHHHTALYWLDFDGQKVHGHQLFIDLSSSERQDFMRWLAEKNNNIYSHSEDLDLASHPILFSSLRLKDSIGFISLIKEFLNQHCHRDAIDQAKIGDPAQFVSRQMKLEEKNQQEADLWGEQYSRFISQGLLGEAKVLVSKLQMKILNLTETKVRLFMQKAKNFPELLRSIFLLPCGFLEFAFNSIEPETGVSTLLSSGELVHCPVCDPNKTKEKVHCPPGHSCPRCHTFRQCG